MKKQLALALTAALLAFPMTPGFVMAETTSTTGTTTATTTTTQPADSSTTATTGTTGTTTGTTDGTTQPPAVVDGSGQAVDPGTLPDSPWYWFQTLIEKVQVALTFDPVKKADLIEHQAVENLAEAQALIKKGKTEDAEKALDSYSTKIEQAQNFLEQVKDPTSETSQKVQEALTKVNSNNMVVLGSLLEKLPPQAAQKLALNIVRTVEKAVAKQEKLDKNQTPTTSTGTTTTADTGANTGTTAGTTSGTTATSTTGTTSGTSTVTPDQAQLEKQAQQALEELRVALGLKKDNHTPNGNAYGYYKNGREDEDKDEDHNVTSNTVQPTQQQTQTQTQQQSTQQQVQTHQPQVSKPAYNPAPKKQDDEDRNEDHGKGEKEKGDRD